VQTRHREDIVPDVALANLHHIALTVTDLEASIRWYERVFGISYKMEEAHEGGVGKLLADEQWRLIIVLHRHEANQRERFSERRTGLDHVGFSVPGRADLEAWQRHLRELGVTQSPIADRPYGSVLVFRDPDNIQLELIAPPSS
jgi:catechol 2,3-dioxygenase-like lactoylglutathione lyase family enzyme